MLDPYAVLGVSPDANLATIKRAFRQRAKALHPDANPGDPVAAAAFRELTMAYALVSDPGSRAKVDAAQPPDADADLDEREAGQGSSTDWDEAFKSIWSGAERRPDPRRWRPIDPDFPYEDEWETEAAQGDEKSSHWPEEPWTAMEAAGLDPDQDSGRQSRQNADTDESDLFDELYASPDLGRKRSRKAARHESLDQHYTIAVPFMTAACGGRRRLLLAGGRDVEIAIPAGVGEGEILRFHGLGSANPSGGDAGDALITVTIDPHPLFRREGEDIVIAVPIGLDEAVLGASIRVPTLDGVVRAKLPAWVGAKAKLKLKERGLPKERGNWQGPRGDQILEVHLVLPSAPDPELEAFVRSWRTANNPRRDGGFDKLVERLTEASQGQETIVVKPDHHP